MEKALAALSAAIVIVAFSTTGATSAPTDTSFVDAAGDQRGPQGAGLDITLVEVTNTNDGVVTFRVTIGNHRVLPPRSFIAVFFDLDKNQDTGDLGDDAQIGWSPESGLTLERWGGDRFVRFSVHELEAGFSDGVFTLRIPRTELANAASFDFLIGTLMAAEQGNGTDVAPALGSHWTYEIVERFTLSASRPTATPKQPVAGKRFTVSMAVTRADTGEALGSGSVLCAARVGTAKLRAVSRYASGTARCAMTVPRGTRGKTLRGTITARGGGSSVTKSFSFRVARR
jgi:hypothetical protein